MVIGMASSSASSAAAKSPPIAEPPMPARVMLRTSAYAGGSGAAFPIDQASRTCFERSLMRSSMLSLSAARIRSTVSMTEASTYVCCRRTTFSLATAHHPLPRVQHRPELVLRARLGVDPDEGLGPRESHQEPRAVVHEELHAVLRVEGHDLRDRVTGKLARLRGIEPPHDLHLPLRVGRGLEVQVAPEIEGGTRERHELGDQLARLLLRLQHEIKEEQ